MITVLTGDIINSTNSKTETWLKRLKNCLAKLQPDNTLWSVFRGDSFQIELDDPIKAFEAALYIKACIKLIDDLDVRIAVGLGEKGYEGNMVNESNGPAFMYSGQTLESIKKEKINLKIRSGNSRFDEEMNLYFKLALIAMDGWSVKSSEVVKLYLENPEARQEDLATILNTSQNAISKRMKRAHLDELLELNKMFKFKLNDIA